MAQVLGEPAEGSLSSGRHKSSAGALVPGPVPQAQLSWVFREPQPHIRRLLLQLVDFCFLCPAGRAAGSPGMRPRLRTGLAVPKVAALAVN